MQSFRLTLVIALIYSLLPFQSALGQTEALAGYTQSSSTAERDWEQKFRQIPSPDNIRQYNQRLSARPHNVGSAYDKDNAEWMMAQFKSWGGRPHRGV